MRGGRHNYLFTAFVMNLETYIFWKQTTQKSFKQRSPTSKFSDPSSQLNQVNQSACEMRCPQTACCQRRHRSGKTPLFLSPAMNTKHAVPIVTATSTIRPAHLRDQILREGPHATQSGASLYFWRISCGRPLETRSIRGPPGSSSFTVFTQHSLIYKSAYYLIKLVRIIILNLSLQCYYIYH